MKLFNKKTKGVGLIEFLIVLMLSMVFIVTLLKMYSNYAQEEIVDAKAKDYDLILESVIKRVVHDSAEWALWQATAEQEITDAWGYSPVPSSRILNTTNNYILWQDSEAVVKSLMRNFLVGKDYPDANCGGWNAEPDPISGDTETLRTAYIPCRMFQKDDAVIIPFNIKLMAAAVGDTGTNATLANFLLYLDLKDTDLIKGYAGKNGLNSLTYFKNQIEKNLKREQLGTQYVELVTNVGNLESKNDDKISTVRECLDAINSNNSCYIRLSISFVDSSSSEYLLVSGNNDMKAAISFRDAASSTPQQCAIWKNDGSGGWVANTVDCGIWGGVDSSTVDGVLDNTHSNNVYITLKDGSGTTLDHQCPIYEKPANEDNGYFTKSTEVSPCGLLNDGSVVQLITDYAYIGKIYTEDLMVQDLRANRLKVKYDPTNYNNPKLVQILDDNSNVLFEVNSSGYIQFGTPDNNSDGVNDLEASLKINGSLEVSDDFSASGNSIFVLDKNGDLVTVKVDDNAGNNLGNINIGDVITDTSIVDATRDTIAQYGATTTNKKYMGISIANNVDGFGIATNNDMLLKAGDDMSLRASDNINIQANNINLEGNTLVNGSNKIYSNTSSFRDKKVETLNASKNFYNLTSAEKDNFELLTKDYGKHLKNLIGNLTMRSVVLINGSGSNIVSKPNCLDFTSAGNDLSNPYYGTSNYNTDGKSLARILLVPLWLKTYSEGFGDNQAYTHHAISTGNNWEVYQYLSGSGASGTGAREDGAGASLGLIFCDYSSVSW